MAALRRHGAERPEGHGAQELSSARPRAAAAADRRLSPVRLAPVDTVGTATLAIDTAGPGFTDITADARRFLREVRGHDGTLTVFVRHTSASITIQENADPDVQGDLLTALARLAPDDAGWVHDAEGPDDMPAHVKAMLTGVSLQVPVVEGAMVLGTWQGLYLVEHRAKPHRRKVVLQFLGARGERC